MEISHSALGRVHGDGENRLRGLSPFPENEGDKARLLQPSFAPACVAGSPTFLGMLPCLLADLLAAASLFLLGCNPTVSGSASGAAPRSAASLLAASLYCLNPASVLAGAGCDLRCSKETATAAAAEGFAHTPPFLTSVIIFTAAQGRCQQPPRSGIPGRCGMIYLSASRPSRCAPTPGRSGAQQTLENGKNVQTVVFQPTGSFVSGGVLQVSPGLPPAIPPSRRLGPASAAAGWSRRVAARTSPPQPDQLTTHHEFLS